jgi:hypothetical protein
MTAFYIIYHVGNHILYLLKGLGCPLFIAVNFKEHIPFY